MNCDIVLEKAIYNGKEYEKCFLDFGNNVRVEIRDYILRDKLVLIKNLIRGCNK